MNKEWAGFKEGSWTKMINVDDFININYTPYDGDESFLAGPTARTTECNEKVKELLVEERKNGGTLKVDASRIMKMQLTIVIVTRPPTPLPSFSIAFARVPSIPEASITPPKHIAQRIRLTVQSIELIPPLPFISESTLYSAITSGDRLFAAANLANSSFAISRNVVLVAV